MSGDNYPAIWAAVLEGPENTSGGKLIGVDGFLETSTSILGCSTAVGGRLESSLRFRVRGGGGNQREPCQRCAMKSSEMA